MKRNLLLLSLLSCTLLSGCNKIPSESVKPSETVQPSESVKSSESVKPTYKIVITDIDGENLGSKDIELTENRSVFDDLVANFDVNYTTSEYGPYLSSINNSVIDVNYYLAIYENNQAASTGVDGLVADENDVFEFKVECWNTLSSGYGTLDDYDLLVDKAIYGYMKQLDLSTSTTNYTLPNNFS